MEHIPKQTQQESEKKKKKKKSPLFIIILIIAIGIFVFAGYNLLKIYLRYKEASDTYKHIEEVFETTVDETTSSGDDPESENSNDKVPFVWDFNKLKRMNPDSQGWIYEEDLLNYPIVQGADNDYYLHRLFDGTYNFAGTLFVDYQMPEGLSGLYSIVYGHNMNDGSMFGRLQRYRLDTDFYSLHPTMHVFIGEKHYIYNVVAAYTAHVGGFTYSEPLNNGDVTDFIEKAREESVYPMYQGKITDKTNIIVLSTCTPASEEDYRFVVILSRDHEVTK